MKINIICQPGAEKTHWCALYLKGIYSEAKRKGDTVFVLSVQEAAEAFKEDKPISAAILSTSRAWIEKVAAILSELGVEPIVIGGASRDAFRHASYVFMDYREATYQLIEYLRAYKKNRIALFAVNSDSATDMIKKDAFLSYDKCREHDVFYYTGADGLMNSACERFMEVCRNYDAVICSNDASAVILLHQLEEAGIKIPEDLFLCSFGDMAISSSGKKTLTMARLNCVEVGKQTVKVCHHLTSSPSISSISTKIRCDFIIGDTTANLPVKQETLGTSLTPDGTASLFHSDPSVSRIFLAEKILSACDAIDIDLLKLIINGYKYFDIAEILHVSESTIKYRLKRIIQIAELDSRDEVIDVMKMFLN
ncbi:MAG: substrate-binding domain-containing protein [Clostridia bacterium]|nr:substrate-binding domain-containing protein [Clostridia bacterium]